MSSGESPCTALEWEWASSDPSASKPKRRDVPCCPFRIVGFRCLGATLAIAAFSICVKGGLMPHALHGCNGVFAFALVRSKLGGRMFEKEQMGHTQVTDGLTLLIAPCLGLPLRGKGDAVALREGS